MRFLLSNDDGIHADGLRVLWDMLASLAEVLVVAPDRNRSAASHSLTLDRPLRMQRVAENAFAVNGTPTDCVHLAVAGLLKNDPPQLVVSGINEGANLGDDVLYSGTVAAAMEGRFLGCPAMAFSLAAIDEGPLIHYDTAAALAKQLVTQFTKRQLPSETILNVNVPNLPLKDIKGIRATRLGFRHRSESVIVAHDPKGREVFWIGSAGPAQDNGPGTDFHAIANHFVSITPLHIDLTRHVVLSSVATWIEDLA